MRGLTDPELPTHMDAGRPDSSQLVLGRYRLTARLTKGDSSRIYRAVNPAGELVAIKVLRARFSRDRSALHRFYDEAKTAMRFDDERLLPVYEVGEHAGRHCQVMPLIQGATLRQHVGRTGPMAEQQALRLIHELQAGVTAIHRGGQLHGRLHPDNVLVSVDGRVLLKGMSGLAESLPSLSVAAREPLADRFCYYAPEQLARSAALDERSDVYSLTALLYFLLTAEVPFPSANLEALLRAKRSSTSYTRSPRLRHSSRHVLELLHTGLAWAPAHRPRRRMFAGLTGGQAESVGGYRVRTLLGRGNSALVYRATNAEGRDVALKVLRPELAQSASRMLRFAQEGRLAMQVRHPHLVQMLDVGQALGRHFLALEYVDGESVAWQVQKQGRLSERRALEIISEIASAVQMLHRHRLVHRDIKPSNILLTKAGRAKLSDLGLTKDLEHGPVLTRAGQGLGTPQYMAPEQFREAADAHPGMDIYSLGATLYVMVTGRLPFGSSSLLDQLRRKMTNDFKGPRAVNPRLSPRLDALIRRAMDADPGRRPQSVDEFLVEVLGCLLDLQTQTRAEASGVLQDEPPASTVTDCSPEPPAMPTPPMSAHRGDEPQARRRSPVVKPASSRWVAAWRTAHQVWEGFQGWRRVVVSARG